MSGRGSSARGRVRLCVCARVRTCEQACVCACVRVCMCAYACVLEVSGRRWAEGVDVDVGVLEWRDGWMSRVENGDVDTERL